VRLLSKLR